MKTYSEKLLDPRWQKKRLEILSRDEFVCTMCYDDKTTLHIHHKKYIKNKEPWDCPNNHLQTVCKDCHKILEFYKIQFTIKKLKKFNCSLGKLFLIQTKDNPEIIYFEIIGHDGGIQEFSTFNITLIHELKSYFRNG